MTFRTSMMIDRDLGELGRAADQLRAWLAGVLDDDNAACVELALVEALTNSVRHGQSAGAKPIGIFLDVSENNIVVEIEDDSPPMPTLFDGAGAAKLELDSVDLENLPEGGRGLSLIVVSMDEVSFVQSGEKVRLRMVKYRQ